MNPDKLAKIRAIALDQRGDPATRAVAQRILARYAKEPPAAPQPFKDPRHPGMRTSPEYDQYRFMDLNGWKKTAGGDPTFTIMRAGRSFRIVLFRHKRTPTWGWMRINTMTDETEFSGKYATQAEAHGGAWLNLMAL